MMSSACQNGDYNIYQYLSFDDTGLRKYNKKLECLYCKDVPEKNLEGGVVGETLKSQTTIAKTS